MFEDATFESSGRIRTRSRRWMFAAFLCNGSILLAMVVIPLIYPDALPRHMISILMEVPLTDPPHTQPQQQQPAHSNNTGFSVPTQTPSAQPRIQIGPFQHPSSSDDPPRDISMGDPGNGNGLPNGKGPFSPSGAPVVVLQQKGPLRISSLVSTGHLIYRKLPAYPSIGRSIRLQGTVVLQAIISKGGTIENLRVISGPAMLQAAAIDAVKDWRYEPYKLDGEAVEVETTVNVEFKLE